MEYFSVTGPRLESLGILSALSKARMKMEMKHAALTPILEAKFDRFLQFQIGEEPSGMPISVLSALARQNLDPWGEAMALDRMPTEMAIERLAELIRALPSNNPVDRLGARSLATRLCARLPNISRAGKSPDRREAGGFLGSRFLVVFILMYFVLRIWAAFGSPPA
ncbi:hypothetical protein [Pseudokordiimonas caeni]|uniref:hypothetical protein n=1 Tax=Pseudokordiimonas caeni TaxID=2997908 RepID=UPI0028122473|nr:hypothetical protein [Pseudokordiimonas caeni]